MPTELNVLDPAKPARAAINGHGRLVDCPARGLRKSEFALALPFRWAREVKAGRDHQVKRPAGIHDSEGLRTEIEPKLLIENAWRCLGHIPSAARNAFTHRIGRRIEPEVR